MLARAGLAERLVIDASHDNSAKDPVKQMLAADLIGDQVAAGNAAIVGVMLESFLVEGRQDLGGDSLVHGQSITDPCIDWDHTVTALEGLAAAVRTRRG
jgi:3-deoxy-7-phosphoheptulonate synthase